MNPLAAETEESTAYVKQWLSLCHEEFIGMVQEQRNGKWKLSDQEVKEKVFEADVYMGEEALRIG